MTLPVSAATNVWAVLNDDGTQSPPISLHITDIEEILCPGKCPKKEDVSYISSYFNKKFRYKKGLKDLLVMKMKRINMFTCY